QQRRGRAPLPGAARGAGPAGDAGGHAPRFGPLPERPRPGEDLPRLLCPARDI
ncbi:hypothetical protein IWQ57_003417, partial [Coemansia nantahalensis]